MDDATNLALIDSYIAAYNAFDIEGMVALLSPAIRFENYSGDELTASASGIDAFQRLAEQSRSIFSDREQRVISVEVRAGSATVTIGFRGRLATDIPNGPSAGTTVALQGESEFSFHDGKIGKIIDRA